MSLAADRPEFAPPPQRGTPRAIAFALAAHAVLIAALTWGVHWKRDAESDAVEAEIWSTTVQQAAPRLTQPPAPVPPPAPAPTPAPPPPPPPPPPAARAPEPAPAPRPPDIALEREKKAREQKEREQEIEQAKQEKKMEAAKKAAQEKKELEAKRRAEEQAEDRKEAQEKAQADARKKKEAEAKQQQQQQAEAAKKKEADAAKQAAADRAATLKRMQGLAGASGDDNATGTALKSSGPSGSYGGRVAAAVRPNVVFPDAELVNGNPGAEFEVKLAPDGTIVGTPRLVKSSGLPAWDQAALRALQKTEKLPRDIDGRVPPALIVELKPKR
ncbi:cell envelope integrity protein TolA [Variovorax sp. LT1R16]|uniref:cell envelope integrity protein TolA n=1 Tax=Variovorax sp. LT1R16 TaxID=3443728 RepID=UPI003F487F03